MFFGSKLVPVEYRKLGRIREARDGYPLEIEGLVVKGGNPAYVIWNDKKIKVYLRNNQTLVKGDFVKLIGIVRVYGSKITMYAYNTTVIKDEGTSKSN